MSEFKFVDVPCQKADLDTFFPDSMDHEKIALAKSICDRCTKTAECLSFAFATQSNYGVFGGLTEIERARIKRRNQRAAVKNG